MGTVKEKQKTLERCDNNDGLWDRAMQVPTLHSTSVFFPATCTGRQKKNDMKVVIKMKWERASGVYGTPLLCFLELVWLEKRHKAEETQN